MFALAAAGWGFRLLRARQRSSALTWFLWSRLLLVIVQGLMTYALLRPLFIIQQNLAKSRILFPSVLKSESPGLATGAFPLLRCND